jgi:nuclear mRNA export protein PCID2/THP1
MRYLVPLNILFGNYPDDKLLEEHNLNEYKGITHACKTGSAALFEQEIEKNEERFLKFGIYLVLEKLKNVVYRNYFLDFYEENKQSHIIKLDLITENYKKSLEENKSKHRMDNDEENIDIMGME